MALTRRKKRRIRRIILLTVMVAILAAVIYMLPSIVRISKLRDKAIALVAASSADTFHSTQTTEVYDTNGELLLTMRAARDMYYVEYENIPQTMIDAFVIMEDKKFFRHDGIDYMGIVRAMIANRQSNDIEQGASTITQQLARNIFLTQDVTWERKITEIFAARELEKRYSKEQILEFYLNNIYFANGCYGIEAAARGYFSRSVSELTVSQMAFLAAIPNSPNRYNPLEHFDDTIERRNLILAHMYEENKINTVNFHAARGEEIVLNLQATQHNNYVDTYVRKCATESLMKAFGFNFNNNFDTDEAYSAYCDKYDQFYGMCQQKLFGGGYTVYTSIDINIQKLLQASVDDNLAGYTEVNEEGIYALQSAAVCIDNANGNVVAAVGGRTQDYDGYTLNRAYQSYRQPGSSIKPLNVYMPYLQLGATPDSVVTDDAIEGGPKNADGGFAGDITLREAVKWSKNTVAWSIYDRITPRAGTAFLIRLGFKKVYVDKDRLAGCLGGFTYGVTPEEMAGGYAAIENDGLYRKPTCITRITTSDGREIVNTSERSVQVYDKEASRMMTDMLQTAVKEGTGRDADIDSAIVAGKTGTTNDNKDSWFVGYSRYYTTSVWVGYDMPRTLGSAVNYNKSIWHDFMEQLHMGLPQLTFTAYKKTEQSPHMQQDMSLSETAAMTKDQTEGTASTQNDAVDISGLGDRDADISGLGDRDASIPSIDFQMQH